MILLYLRWRDGEMARLLHLKIGEIIRDAFMHLDQGLRYRFGELWQLSVSAVFDPLARSTSRGRGAVDGLDSKYCIPFILSPRLCS